MFNPGGVPGRRPHGTAAQPPTRRPAARAPLPPAAAPPPPAISGVYRHCCRNVVSMHYAGLQGAAAAAVTQLGPQAAAVPLRPPHLPPVVLQDAVQLLLPLARLGAGWLRVHRICRKEGVQGCSRPLPVWLSVQRCSQVRLEAQGSAGLAQDGTAASHAARGLLRT